MQFKVIYRGAQGKKIEEIFESEDRKTLFNLLKNKRINPIQISVYTGDKHIKSIKRFITLWINILTFLILCLIVVFSIRLINTRDGFIENEQPFLKRSDSTKGNVLNTSQKTNNTFKSVNGESVTEKKAQTNKTEQISEKSKNAEYDALVKKWKERHAKHRPIFTNSSDQFLSMIATANPNQELPPMPITRSVNEEFAKSYKVPIVINKNDSDSVKAVKQAVMELREEVAAIIESEGLSVYDIYTRHQDLMREVVMLRKIAQKEALSIYTSGDMEKVHHYVQDANKILRSAGADEIKVPSETESEATKRLKENLYRLKENN